MMRLPSPSLSMPHAPLATLLRLPINPTLRHASSSSASSASSARQGYSRRFIAEKAKSLKPMDESTGKKLAAASLTVCVTLFAASRYFEPAKADTPSEGLHPPHQKWGFKGHADSFDHASLRRGYQVYKEVCAACHSLKRVAYRHMINVTHSRAELKEIAAETEYEDGPDEEGNMFSRPGVLTDYHKPPYANDEAARAANSGSLPPDLSLIAKARHGGPDYLFALLTGYADAPPGLEVRPGLHYNPYFPGGAIGMAQSIYDGVVDYPDGTPATASQIAKDVTEFLMWAAEPHYEERKRVGMKILSFLAIGTAACLAYKRYKWNVLKSRKIMYKPTNSKLPSLSSSSSSPNSSSSSSSSPKSSSSPPRP